MLDSSHELAVDALSGPALSSPPRRARGRRPVLSMDVKAAPNGVATIEDRILRITGYYGYYPGYSSQKSKTPRALPGSRRRRG